MSLDNAKVISFDGFRAIGLKNSDKEKLEKAQESSFEVPEAVVEPAPEENVMSEKVVAPEVNNAPVSEPNMFDQQPVVEPAPVMETEPVQEVPNTNIFDQPDPVMESAPVNTPVTPEMPKTNEVPTESNVLDTPQTFFSREENVENTNVMEEDPLMIILDNAKKLVEDKNAMIKALNDKILVLEEQLRVSEEGRKVSEAQRVAAETTLTNARIAETSETGGPSLVYQNPTNGNMAA